MSISIDSVEAETGVFIEPDPQDTVTASKACIETNSNGLQANFDAKEENLDRLKSEIVYQNNLRNLATNAKNGIKEAQTNTTDYQKVTQALLKHGNNKKRWPPLCYSIYVGDYEAALILIRLVAI